jgi:hypothetical protein
MTSIAKSDVFFFITSVAVVVLSIGIAVALVYILRILRDLKELSSKAKDEGSKILDDMRSLREHARGGGVSLAGVMSLLGFAKKIRKTTKKMRKNEEDEV